MEFGAAALRDGAEPETPPGFARVRVLACGVCATDLHLLHGMVLPRGAAYPVRPGHEIAGIVEHVNGDGARVKEGDLAILHPLATCGHCQACLAERTSDANRCGRSACTTPAALPRSWCGPPRACSPPTGSSRPQRRCWPTPPPPATTRSSSPRFRAGGSLCVLGAGGLGTATLAVARALDPDVRLAAVVRSDSSAQRLHGLGIEVHRGLVGAARRCDTASGAWTR